MSEAYRVENAIAATSSGNLTWEKWPHDNAVALGFAGVRNPLGFALVRFMSGSPAAADTWNVVMLLATMLMRRKGTDQAVAREMAFRAFEWYQAKNCQVCHGTGIEKQRTCSVCHGAKTRPMPARPVEIKDAIGYLIDAEHWLDRQLEGRLRGAVYHRDDAYRVNLPALSGTQDSGFNSRPDTGLRGAHDSD